MYFSINGLSHYIHPEYYEYPGPFAPDQYPRARIKWRYWSHLLTKLGYRTKPFNPEAMSLTINHTQYDYIWDPGDPRGRWRNGRKYCTITILNPIPKETETLP